MLQGAADQNGAGNGPHQGDGLAKKITEGNGQQATEDEGGEDPGSDGFRGQAALASDGENNRHGPGNGEQPGDQGVDQIVPVEARQTIP
jgi:hypothetical protein